MRVLNPHEIQAGHAVGGKARGLLRLAQAGAPVPPWVVLPAEEVARHAWDEGQLAALFEKLAQPPFLGVALRSSAAAEDSEGGSQAGVYETRFASALEELAPALDAVAGAAKNARAGVHAGEGDPGLAIVIQAGVEAAMAGVLFSADPAAARLDEALVEIVHGAGEGLVSGNRNPSRAWIGVPGGEVIRIEPGEDGPGNVGEELAATLATTLLAVEEVFACAVDIEFVVAEDGRVWFVQARPLTALAAAPALRPARCATSWFFDQRFSRPISPITRTSLLPLIVDAGPGCAVRMRGRDLPEDALHFYGGQAYLAHDVYRAMFSGAPRWLLSADLHQIFPETCYCESPMQRDTFHYLRTTIGALAVHFGEALLNLPRWARFRDGLDEALETAERPWRDAPSDINAWLRAWDQLNGLTRDFLALHRWSLLWADYGYRIYRALLACMPAPARRHVEKKLRTELRIVTREANAAAAACIQGNGDPAEFRARYGHRSASLDYAEPTWADLLEAGRLAEDAPTTNDAPEKQEPRGLLSLLMAPLRRALEMREEQRFHWERILARQRVLLQEAGIMLETRDALDESGDVWYLEWDALLRALRGEATPGAAGIARRKHARHVEARIPKPAFIGPREYAPAQTGGDVLRGVGVSAGRVTGTAVVMPDGPILEHLPEDAIAVLRNLDPAGSILLPRVKGVVLARGGMLAHAAILAREYGVPMVTAIDEATTQIRHGAQITLDGEAGTVKTRERLR